MTWTRIFAAAPAAVRAFGARVDAKIDELFPWVSGHRLAIGRAVTIALLLCFPLDLWLVLNGYTSISETIWALTLAHPTLYALGFLILTAVLWAVWESRPDIVLMCLLAGHLLIHW